MGWQNGCWEGPIWARDPERGYVVLGIETSCDETAAAVVENGFRVRSNLINSQIPVHQTYGGVVPEIASRHHLENLTMVVEQALDQAGLSFGNLDAVAVTNGPGLVGALLVGVAAAKAMAYALGLPLISVHHLTGHIYANFLDRPAPEFPLLCLVVSGGHTSLIYMTGHGRYEILGQTYDDAAGEAFDKVARAMGLGYPGGPLIDRVAREGDPRAIDFPRARLGENSLDFSFSGLKSAVLNFLNQSRQKGKEIRIPDLAASFQQAVVDVLVEKTMRAAKLKGVSTVILAGGVAANSSLRAALERTCRESGLRLNLPPLSYCTDNAAMIAAAGYYRLLAGEIAALDLNAMPNLPLAGLVISD